MKLRLGLASPAMAAGWESRNADIHRRERGRGVEELEFGTRRCRVQHQATDVSPYGAKKPPWWSVIFQPPNTFTDAARAVPLIGHKRFRVGRSRHGDAHRGNT